MTMRAPSAVRDLWKVVIAWGALTLILGILVLAKPGTSFVVTGALLGAYLVMSGIVEMVLTFVLDVSASSRIPLFISGALSLSLGVLAFRHLGYAYAVLLLAIWIGVGFIFRGVATTISAISDPALPGRGWEIFVGVISLLAGIVVLASPFASIVTLAIVAGVWFVVIGVFEIVSSFGIRKASKNFGR